MGMIQKLTLICNSPLTNQIKGSNSEPITPLRIQNTFQSNTQIQIIPWNSTPLMWLLEIYQRLQFPFQKPETSSSLTKMTHKIMSSVIMIPPNTPHPLRYLTRWVNPTPSSWNSKNLRQISGHGEPQRKLGFPSVM